MDIITQGLLGGVLAQSAASKDEKNRASVVGVLAGLIADADILIYSASDPLLNIEYHRHFSHSLAFIPVGAALACLLLWPFMRRHLSVPRLYLFCLLGYSLSGVIDACTSYGTHLFWPFSEERVAWHVISIVDPLFTLILLVTFVVGLRLKLKKVALIGLSLSVCYMLFGFIQLQRAEKVAQELAVSRGHDVTKQVVKPTLANLLLWRSTYIAEQRIYVDAIRLGTFDDNRVYEGESVAQFVMTKDIADLDSSTALYDDIQRFTKFSDDFVAYDPRQKNVLGDIRYSMLPTSINPLWGITIDRAMPDIHASYHFFRENNEHIRQQFMDMLFGRELHLENEKQ